ncbi:hypothetical protein FRC12_021729, partial [Ceratobasidium sp. 428]
MTAYTVPYNIAQYATFKNILCLSCGLVVIKLRDNLVWLVNSWRSPLRHLPGPNSDNLLLGNLLTIANRQNTYLWEDWFGTYGKTMRYWGFF